MIIRLGTALTLFLAVVVIGILVSFRREAPPPQETPGLNVDLSRLIPQEWVPIGQLRAVNLDADLQEEYLLFYHYDAGQRPDGSPVPGPIGATIYDPVPPGSFREMDPGTAASGLQPFPLLPSQRPGDGQGFLAPPTQTEAPVYYPVSRVLAAEIQTGGPPSPPEATPPYDELLVLGGQGSVGRWTHISAFWWHSFEKGYLGVQITAPGGLHILEWQGEARASPIARVRAYYPQHDRSVLCRVSVFVRVLDPEADGEGKVPWRPSVRYVEIPQGLDFCYGVPESPFYPEGTALAFLQAPQARGDLLAPAPDTGAALDDPVQTVLSLGPHRWVDALYYPMTPETDPSTPGRALTTWVQAQMVTLPEAPQVGSSQSPERTFRCVRLELRRDLGDPGTGDAWAIVAVRPVEPTGPPGRPCAPSGF